MIKFTRESITDSDPFHEVEYEKVDNFTYAYYYLYYGFGCILNYLNIAMFDKVSQLDIYNNFGECHNSLFYIIGYTLSLFVIQYNLNSILHHNYIRWVNYAYAFMVPVTIVAFLLAA